MLEVEPSGRRGRMTTTRSGRNVVEPQKSDVESIPRMPVETEPWLLLNVYRKSCRLSIIKIELAVGGAWMPAGKVQGVHVHPWILSKKINRHTTGLQLQ